MTEEPTQLTPPEANLIEHLKRRSEDALARAKVFQQNFPDGLTLVAIQNRSKSDYDWWVQRAIRFQIGVRM